MSEPSSGAERIIELFAVVDPEVIDKIHEAIDAETAELKEELKALQLSKTSELLAEADTYAEKEMVRLQQQLDKAEAALRFLPELAYDTIIKQEGDPMLLPNIMQAAVDTALATATEKDSELDYPSSKVELELRPAFEKLRAWAAAKDSDSLKINKPVTPEQLKPWMWKEQENGRYEMFLGRSRLAENLTRADALTLEKYHNTVLSAITAVPSSDSLRATNCGEEQDLGNETLMPQTDMVKLPSDLYEEKLTLSYQLGIVSKAEDYSRQLKHLAGVTYEKENDAEANLYRSLAKLMEQEAKELRLKYNEARDKLSKRDNEIVETK